MSWENVAVCIGEGIMAVDFLPEVPVFPGANDVFVTVFDAELAPYCAKESILPTEVVSFRCAEI